MTTKIRIGNAVFDETELIEITAFTTQCECAGLDVWVGGQKVELSLLERLSTFFQNRRPVNAVAAKR